MQQLEPIQISGLGRQVFIGNLYNYFYGHVLPSGIQIPWSGLQIKNVSPPETRQSFFYQHTLKFIDSSVGIDSHVKENIQKGLLNPSYFWFAKYLYSPLTEANDFGARVTVHFRVVRRTDTMDLKFLQTQLQNYQTDCNGRATHVVKQVSYGAEFIICMRKPVDYNKETKDSAEYNMYRAAVKYFDEVIKTNWTSTEISTELADVSCTIFNSLNVNYVMVDSFQHSVHWLKSAIKLDGCHEKWLEWTLPVEIGLHHIPTPFDNGRLLPLILSNKEKDAQLEIDRIWCDLWNEYRFLESHRVYKTLNNRQRIPLNPSPVCLHHIGAQLISVREQFIRKNTDKALIKDFMVRASQWIGHRKEQYQIFNEIYDELDRLPFVHLQHVTPLPPTSSQHNLKLFVILFFYEQDVLLFEIENLVSSLLLIPPVRRTIFRANFPIFSTGKESFSIFKNQLKDFVEEAKRCANANNVYKFLLVPVGSNPTPKLKDGEIKTIVYPAIKNTPSQTCLPTNPVQQQRKDLIPDGAVNPQIPIGALSTSRQIENSVVDSKLPNRPAQQKINIHHQQYPPLLICPIPVPTFMDFFALPSTSNQEWINEKLSDTSPSLLKRQLDPAPKANPATMPTTELNIETIFQGPPLKKTKYKALAKGPVVDTPTVPVGKNPAPKLNEGDIKTIVYPVIKNTPSQTCLPTNPVQQHRQDSIPPGASNPQIPIGAPSTSRQEQIDSSLIDSKLPNMPGQQQTNLRHQQDPSSLNSSVPATMVLPANSSASSLPSSSNQERINEKLPDTLPSLLKRQLDPAPKAILATVPATELNIEIIYQGPPLKKPKSKTPVVYTERIHTRSQTKTVQTQENAKPTASGNSPKTKSSSTPSNRQLLLETLLNDIELEVLLGNVENLEMKNIPGSDFSECVVAKTSVRPCLIPCSDGFKAYNCRRCRVTCVKPSNQFLDNTERINCELCLCPVSDHALQPFEWSRKRVDIEVNISSQNMLESELLSAKEKVLSLLGRMASKNIPSVALANKAVMPSSPADYLDLLKAHTINLQRPGYLARLKTLADLRKNV